MSEDEIADTLESLNINSETLGCQEIVRILGRSTFSNIRRLIDEEIEEEVRAIFNFFDRDKDGKINAPELK